MRCGSWEGHPSLGLSTLHSRPAPVRWPRALGVECTTEIGYCLWARKSNPLREAHFRRSSGVPEKCRHHATANAQKAEKRSRRPHLCGGLRGYTVQPSSKSALRYGVVCPNNRGTGPPDSPDRPHRLNVGGLPDTCDMPRRRRSVSRTRTPRPRTNCRTVADSRSVARVAVKHDMT